MRATQQIFSLFFITLFTLACPACGEETDFELYDDMMDETQVEYDLESIDNMEAEYGLNSNAEQDNSSDDSDSQANMSTEESKNQSYETAEAGFWEYVCLKRCSWNERWCVFGCALGRDSACVAACQTKKRACESACSEDSNDADGQADCKM